MTCSAHFRIAGFPSEIEIPVDEEPEEAEVEAAPGSITIPPVSGERAVAGAGGELVKARVVAMAALAVVMAVVVWLGRDVYFVMTDSFVAPAILSPDSDIVLANKLKMSELTVERARAAAELEGIELDLAASEKAVQRLEDLRASSTTALDWTSNEAARKANAAIRDLGRLADERKVLVGMVDRQRELTAKAERDFNAGVISRADHEKETQALDQLQLALIENDRTALISDSQPAVLASHKKGLGPEEMVWQEQTVRLELEMLRVEAESRGKAAQKRALEERVGTLDRLAGELRARPIFQAVEKKLDLAFVPYTQMKGVERGASVYSCVWGLFSCKTVGTVAEVVPGEVVLPDPWGNQARGQYAVLTLNDGTSAKDKTLRVRAGGAAAPAPSESDAALVSRR
jgi:hypothetical protein